MRGGVGEQLVDVVDGRSALALVRDDLLDEAAADQPAHGVRDQVNPRRSGLGLEFLDERKQVLGGAFQAVVLGRSAQVVAETS
jgi:hypothetical protein